MIQRIVAIVFPLFSVVLAGYLYARKRPTDMAVANRLNFDVFLPALVFTALAGRSFDLVDNLPLALGAIAVTTKHELVLGIVGGLFVLEAVSVIIQVTSYKLTGKRVFKMAPIHHHFEQLGWTESQVVIRFWIIAVVLALIGLSSLKLR